ncbi:hypothetical protein ACJJI5_13990 [Microbulbifer sp. EKSA008]|uniref:hypothetical protein n=1 Tax=Microbulbifer sp. EKSA008 TaxID=3243367 RepID=UPI004042087F
MKIGKIIILILFTGGNAACSITSNPPITIERAEQFSNLVEFVEKEIGSYQLFDEWESQVESPGVINYRAYFTFVNTKSIRKPIDDVGGYCRVKGGKFYSIGSNEIQVLRDNGVRAAVTSASFAKSLGASDEVAMRSASIATERLHKFYRNSGLAEDQQIISDLSKRGYLGTAVCKLEDRTWSISVVPTAYHPRDPTNQLTSSHLDLNISVTEI